MILLEYYLHVDEQIHGFSKNLELIKHIPYDQKLFWFICVKCSIHFKIIIFFSGFLVHKIIVLVVIAVVFVLVAQSCLTLAIPWPLNFPVCAYLTLNMSVGMAEVPTKHSVKSRRFTKSVTKSLGI